MNELETIELLFDKLWPLDRSITGDGVRKTHKILSKLIPLNTIEIPTGTKVLDWTIPKEWKVNEAKVFNPDGSVLLDFNENNLRLVGYSKSFKGKLSKNKLIEHLHYRSDIPDAIPYVTSYYKENFGFCLTYNEFQSLKDGDYKVVLDTELFDGSLTLSDCIIKGESDEEIMFSSYTCHPSMAINELSGPICLSILYNRIRKIKNRKYTYRFILCPETIGSVAYLHLHGDYLKSHLKGGLILDRLGNKESLVYHSSIDREELVNRVCKYVLNNYELTDQNISFRDFTIGESDDRQYNSIGYRLPVGSLFCEDYNEYHTSLDNKKLISFDHLVKAINILEKIVKIFETDCIYQNSIIKGEPFLSKYNLHNTLGGITDDYLKALKYLVFYCDGSNSILDLAIKSGLNFDYLKDLAEEMCQKSVLKRIIK
ncbi:MAG: aminopeptidase [Rhodopirellula sp.]|nr:aminopeptidase [Rhodopirellula sp.]